MRRSRRRRANWPALEPEIAADAARVGAEPRTAPARHRAGLADGLTDDAPLADQTARERPHLTTSATVEPATSATADMARQRASFAPGTLGASSRSFDGKHFVDAGDVADFDYLRSVHARRLDQARERRTARFCRACMDDAEAPGLRPVPEGRQAAGSISSMRWLDDAHARRDRSSRSTLNRWHHVAVTYDGSRLGRRASRSTSTASRSS